MAGLSRINIADKRARITLCSAKDVAADGGMMRLTREGIYSAYAVIAQKRGAQSSRDGITTTANPLGIATHTITCAYRPSVEISNAAWIYRARLKSAPQWFRILSVSEIDRQFVFACRLYERSDEALPPAERKTAPLEAMPLPAGVHL